MMVSTLLINNALKASLPLVKMVDNIGYAIGLFAAFFTHDPVFIVAKVTGA